MAVPLVDLLLAVIRRTRAGRNPFAPDKRHLHHRLLEMGHSQMRAVLLMYAWTALVAGTAVAMAFVPLGYAVVGFFMGLGLLVLAVRSPGKQSPTNVRALHTGTGG
jgi:UDP-GlcNAc:undecaprenyl-phosphate GlcNAc-1-phosphate transferase